jgi:hypothetical protein
MKLTGNLFMTSFPSALAGNLPWRATQSSVASAGIRRARVPLSPHVEEGLEVIPFPFNFPAPSTISH